MPPALCTCSHLEVCRELARLKGNKFLLWIQDTDLAVSQLRRQVVEFFEDLQTGTDSYKLQSLRRVVPHFVKLSGRLGKSI